MSKLVPIRINNFSGGVSDDAREDNATKYRITKHFDVFSNPFRLTPYRSLEADTETSVSDTDLKQYDVRDFTYASASSKLWGLGKTAGGLTKIVYKADATTGLWTLPTSSEGDGSVKYGCLSEYKDYLWGFQGTTQVFKYGILSGTPSITNTAGTVGNITSVAQGVVAKDDQLYLPYNNKLARVSAGGTVTDAALTLPSYLKITSLTNYGNYLAIGCSPLYSYNGVSKVFLWNLTSTEVQEAIDWGEGELRVLETIEGYLVGVTDRNLNSSSGAGLGSMIIQIYTGGVPQVVKEVFTDALTGKSIPISKAVKNNRLFFAAKIMTDGGSSYNEGIWSFGRKNVNYPFSLTLDIIDENINTTGITSFGTAANYFFIAHSGDGSIDKTNDSASYTFTSVYESQILNFGAPHADKQLLGLKVSTRKQASGESLTAKYRVNNATSWTTIGTWNTDDEMSHTFTGIESTEQPFASGYEYEFRLESTGGLEITGIEIIANVNDAV